MGYKQWIEITIQNRSNKAFEIKNVYFKYGKFYAGERSFSHCHSLPEYFNPPLQLQTKAKKSSLKGRSFRPRAKPS